MFYKIYYLLHFLVFDMKYFYTSARQIEFFAPLWTYCTCIKRCTRMTQMVCACTDMQMNSIDSNCSYVICSLIKAPFFWIRACASPDSELHSGSKRIEWLMHTIRIHFEQSVSWTIRRIKCNQSLGVIQPAGALLDSGDRGDDCGYNGAQLPAHK